jgi:DNA-directed RNA polymerase
MNEPKANESGLADARSAASGERKAITLIRRWGCRGRTLFCTCISNATLKRAKRSYTAWDERVKGEKPLLYMYQRYIFKTAQPSDATPSPAWL